MAEQQTEQDPQSQESTTQESITVEDKERIAREKAEWARQVQALKLNRARICEQLQRTTNERYTALLNTELEQIDGELAKLG